MSTYQKHWLHGTNLDPIEGFLQKRKNAIQTTLRTCEPTLGATGTAAKPRKFRRRKAGFAKQKTLLEQQYVKYMVCNNTIGVIYTSGFQYITQIWLCNLFKYSYFDWSGIDLAHLQKKIGS